MKKLNLLIIMVVATMFSTNLIAQQMTLSNPTTPDAVVRPRVECEALLERGPRIYIVGNNTKYYTLVKSDGKFSNYKFVFRKSSGKAKATFTIVIDNVETQNFTFDNSPTGQFIVNLPYETGKEVKLKVKNLSATNSFSGDYNIHVNSNSMLFNMLSNETHTESFSAPKNFGLNIPCNGKGSIEINRLSGVSSAEVVLRQGSTILKTVQIASNENTKRFNFNNANPNGEFLVLEIRNIQTNKFIRASIGAWFN